MLNSAKVIRSGKVNGGKVSGAKDNVAKDNETNSAKAINGAKDNVIRSAKKDSVVRPNVTQVRDVPRKGTRLDDRPRATGALDALKVTIRCKVFGHARNAKRCCIE